MEELANTDAAFGQAADALERAAHAIREEQAWLRLNHPRPDWSRETNTSYLVSSALSRLQEVTAAARTATAALERVTR
jgi:hypothetical protein